MKAKRAIGPVSAMFAAAVLGTFAAPPAGADPLSAALHQRISAARQACGPIGADPLLTAAAQRHANDVLRTGVASHSGSDGSSPGARIAAAGYSPTRATGEIVYWGAGLAANPGAAVDWWLKSPPHRALLLNCTFTAGGFAVARDGNRMTAVVDFGG
ncbi:CAP domain-containing protein [[Mycobacterium] wendilense]|uniref:CAP domain-containing protein n=1 Tax=[Mycobacterium] wendilense TaxID=3064284 RepID=A0ABN9NYR9_9MYCO|nr:CAP domain-containing protein [Mycolicibacterium sp. MU0050]CAJ1582909.1 CAP domain-containing protein [Mycolicibacterium sp. MU0050]